MFQKERKDNFGVLFQGPQIFHFRPFFNFFKFFIFCFASESCAPSGGPDHPPPLPAHLIPWPWDSGTQSPNFFLEMHLGSAIFLGGGCEGLPRSWVWQGTQTLPLFRIFLYFCFVLLFCIVLFIFFPACFKCVCVCFVFFLFWGDFAPTFQTLAGPTFPASLAAAIREAHAAEGRDLLGEGLVGEAEELSLFLRKRLEDLHDRCPLPLPGANRDAGHSWP